ncbi:uncharacterized protein LOC107045019 [Diachasma alloeum]|uniref:uncharacterized protein LOC107045019 n=1 Tax=Diachasma alloeum TaxID=454923 RepID=UPI0007381952|nr:uncharacterized protein LOC107045019 [Diachasma alloeum]
MRKGKRWFCQWTFLALILPEMINCQKQKRQIFREQVLPALGGKIPEEAFRTDRLALNRLNKEGITVVDGVILEARHADKHPTHDRIQPEVIKVYATVDNRYVPPEGRYHYDQPRTVDTTYVIRKPIGDSGLTLNPPDHRHESTYPPAEAHGYVNFHRQTPVPVPISPPTPPKIYKPIIKPLIIPADHILFSGFYHPSWDHPHAFDWSGSRFRDQLRDEHPPVFDTYQIIENYQGFLDDFHNRRLRHTENPTLANALTAAGKAIKTSAKSAFEFTSPQLEDTKRETSIPETGFSCEGRIGTFADIKANCQVFHECSGWRKTSSTCPFGTAYSEELKRCEWTHQVKCSKRASNTTEAGAVYLNVKLSAVMARSYPVTLRILIIIGGFTFTLSQDQRFRIRVYDDYPEYQEYQEFQDYQAEEPPQEVRHEQVRAPVQLQLKNEERKKDQDFSKIPGAPGVDYPIYHQVPQTEFSCARVPFVPGMYANPETGCQAYHVCHDGREGHQGASFLCSNGTLFNQKEFACDWWYNVDCYEATKHYRLNGDLQTNPFVPKERKDAIAREKLRIAVF